MRMLAGGQYGDFGFRPALFWSLVVLVLFFLFTGIKTVPQGYNYTVERFGRYTRTLTPGLNLIVPFIDRIGAKMNMMEQVLDVPTRRSSPATTPSWPSTASPSTRC